MPEGLSFDADIGLVFLAYCGLIVLVSFITALFIRNSRTLWMIRGFLFLLILEKVPEFFNLHGLAVVFDQLVAIATVAIGFLYQSQVRRFLEKLGQGKIIEIFWPSEATNSLKSEGGVLPRIVESVKELSQTRTGALILIETTAVPIDNKDLLQPGISIDAEVSKELLQSIFYDKNPLHDGAILIRDTRVVAAKLFFHLSEKSGFRQLGTRHLAARSITERVEHCVCVVVSEETGSISLAKGGELQRPLTSSELKERLAAYFAKGDRESVTPSLGNIVRQLKSQLEGIQHFLERLRASSFNKD